MSGAVHIAETSAAQRRAADPATSAFVSANAGSGKTRVLTNRAARLLLAGAAPSKILCITFTKAAAAEMAGRLFDLLGSWALADDATLAEALRELAGTDEELSPIRLGDARRLFARALETPGGLKIQTIHSFCEGVLKRFPLEAGVAPGFSVIEELEQRALVSEAAGATGALSLNEPDLGRAFATLSESMGGRAIRELLASYLLAGRRVFGRVLNGRNSWDELLAEAAGALDVQASDEPAPLIDDVLARMDEEGLRRAWRGLCESGGNAKKNCGRPLEAYLTAARPGERFAALEKLFFKSDGEPRPGFGTGKTAAIDPWIEPFLERARAVFVARHAPICGAEALANTRALYAILARAFDVYEEMKAARAALDFDDLVFHAGKLLADRGNAGWVAYKLDQGLDHILLDEAQDTGRDAWAVIEGPLAEFFAGEGARTRPRTFFAVGDKKQSIYSFQGADAALFAEKQTDLGKTIAAVARHENVPLKASFRSTAPVLSFVDALFALDEVIENVSDEKPLEHFATRDGEAGLVELWPLCPREKADKPDPWDAPLDAVTADNPKRKLADAIALRIAEWLSSGEELQSQARPIGAGDILILVQSRGPLFAEMIRALGARGVPVAGPDRILLLQDQGVLDLVSFARTALYPGDDLSLAETLKSPFFGFDEEALYDLARGRIGWLWLALRDRKDERAEWARAHEEIAQARKAARDGPLAFFSHILENGGPSGWRRLQRRLGAPAKEPIFEFLRQAEAFEAAHPRSLRQFLSGIEASGAEIVREASEAGESVRVMTAHKAKGLEAEIVFILDGHRRPPFKEIGQLLQAGARKTPILAAGRGALCAALVAARTTAKGLMSDEYRRQLYVAATRARDRLYICGHETGNDGDPHRRPPAEKSWHALAEDAFGRLDGIENAGEIWGRPILRLSAPQTAPIPTREFAARDCAGAPPPDYLTRPASPERRAAMLSPSLLAERLQDDSAAFSPVADGDPYRRGRILHRLLELLPEVEAHRRSAAADRLLAHHAGDIDEAERARWRDEVLTVLAHPDFAEAFGPDSLAEVAIGGRAANMLGRIDRLAILPGRILAVDYKTNRPPPARIEESPFAYLAQMAAYRALLADLFPEKRIEAALLWTFEARLMVVPDALLDEAFRRTLVT